MAFNSRKVEQLVRSKGIKAKEFFAASALDTTRGLDEIKEMFSGYDIYVSTSMGDQAAEIIAREMHLFLTS